MRTLNTCSSILPFYNSHYKMFPFRCSLFGGNLQPVYIGAMKVWDFSLFLSVYFSFLKIAPGDEGTSFHSAKFDLKTLLWTLHLFWGRTLPGYFSLPYRPSLLYLSSFMKSAPFHGTGSLSISLGKYSFRLIRCPYIHYGEEGQQGYYHFPFAAAPSFFSPFCLKKAPKAAPRVGRCRRCRLGRRHLGLIPKGGQGRGLFSSFGRCALFSLSFPLCCHRYLTLWQGQEDCRHTLHTFFVCCRSFSCSSFPVPFLIPRDWNSLQGKVTGTTFSNVRRNSPILSA